MTLFVLLFKGSSTVGKIRIAIRAAERARVDRSDRAAPCTLWTLAVARAGLAQMRGGATLLSGNRSSTRRQYQPYS